MKLSCLSERDIKDLLKPYFSSPFVFLETACFDRKNTRSFLFTHFIDTLVFQYNEDIDIFFEKVERYLKKGFWLCGYFTYETGYFLEPALFSLQEKNNHPLVWIGVCAEPVIISHQKYTRDSRKNNGLFYDISKINPNISRKEYFSQLEKIKEYLEKGLTYQVNFTFKMKFDFKGYPFDFYLGLRRVQPTAYMAFIQTENSNILSLSPELFFRIDGGRIISKPMKGTISRGTTAAHDAKNKEQLRGSEKIRAENVMIVDLVRNDLGRIAEHVKVPQLFKVEEYNTLYQMTSTVEAHFKNNTKIKDIFLSLFPCGSVTGAPKIKTMELIQNLEKEKRGVYTGAIGYISPQKTACFNVAIRTICLNGTKGEMGIGGGIVYDSIAKYEYEESLLKAKFLQLVSQQFPVN